MVREENTERGNQQSIMGQDEHLSVHPTETDILFLALCSCFVCVLFLICLFFFVQYCICNLVVFVAVFILFLYFLSRDTKLGGMV